MEKCKLESQISKNVKNTLLACELAGSVLWFERLNAGKVRTEFGSWIQLCRQGTADFIAILPIENGTIVYFMEIKSHTGEQKENQKEFQKQVEEWGAIYEIVRDASQVRYTVEKVTNFERNKLNSIIF